MTSDHALRQHLADLILVGNAHLSFDDAVADLSPSLWGARPPGVPHTPWRLVEHMRIAQWDILEFCRNPHHQSPEFPAGYWPVGDAPPDDLAWDRTVAQFWRDRQALVDLVLDPGVDLFAPIPGGGGPTVLKEALVVADHNAYHLGQLVLVRRALGAWAD